MLEGDMQMEIIVQDKEYQMLLCGWRSCNLKL